MKTKLHNVLRYFSQFGYKPTVEEIHTFFPIKIGKNKLKSYLDKTYKYTLGGYGVVSKVSRRKVGIPTLRSSEESQRSKVSFKKLAMVQKYLDFISGFPQIRLIGLSGSVAMLNAKKTDDIDLFIITARNRIWTARFIVNVVAWTLGLKRKSGEVRAQNKVCLNLFFDESSTFIQKKHHTNYMAHEVLQMVPILDVNRSYRRFLLTNDWIRAFCPNVDPKSYFPYNFSPERYTSRNRQNKQGIIGRAIEILLKQMQIWYMRKPIGDERIEKGQLWFHPRDYGRIIGK